MAQIGGNARLFQHLATYMTTIPFRNGISKRRSSRMFLNAAVHLSGHDHRKASFTVTARATNLNRFGAAVQVQHELSVGSTLVMRNQRGAEVPARVVTQITAAEGIRTYGIEFVEPDSQEPFWGISFPSA